MEIFKSESLYGSNELTQLDVHRLQNDAVSLQSLQLPSCKSALKQVNDLSRRPAMNFASNEVENLHKTSPIPFDPHNLQSLKLSQISIPDSASHPAVQSSNGILTNQLNNNPLTSSGTTRPGKRPAPESPTNMPDSKFGDELSNSGSDGEGQDNSSTTDVEGVWSMDIEQCFQEALAIYPPCGRRKIILSEEGKMYGRNELIARYIYQHTGKIRSRKQVSSHIQVLARRRSKELQAQIKDPDTKQRAIIQLSRLSSAQIVSAGVLGSKPLTGPLTSNSPNVAKSSTPGSATPPEPAKLARSGVNGGVMDFRTAATKGGTERLSTYTNSPHIPSTQTHIPLEQLLHRTNGFSDTMDTQHKFKSKNGLNNTALMASKVAGYSEALALGSGISVGLSSAPVTAMAMAAAQVAAAYGRQVTTEAMCGSLWHNPNILVPPNLSLASSGSLTRSLDENIPNHIKNVSMHQGLDKVAASPEFIQQNFELANQRHGPMNTTDFPYASLQTANPHLVSNQELPRAKEPKLNDELAYAPMKQKSNQLQPQLVNLSDVDPNSLLQRSYPSESMTRFLPDNIEQSWNEGSITAPKMRLVDLSAYILSTTKDGANLPVDQSTQHVFVHIVPSKTPSYAENLLEQVDASQIWDKFPEDSLKELMENGPADTFFLVKFWADVNVQVDSDCTFAVSAVFEGVEDIPLNLSTKVCSFGKQVVEKIEQVEHPRAENGRFVYRFIRSPMCDYMKSFIGKLLQLRRRDMMNSVLENFTILHILRNNATNELLLCIAYVLEVAQENCGSQHHIYKLTRC